MSELDHAAPEYQQIAERYHNVQSEFTARDGYNIESRVGSVLTGLGFRRDDWQKRAWKSSSGGWQNAHRAGQTASRRAESSAARRAHQPPRPRSPQLARNLPRILSKTPSCSSRTTASFDVTVSKIAEIWNKKTWFYTGGYSKYEQQKAERRAPDRSGLCQSARPASKPLEAFINRFRAQATKAKQVQSRIKELEKIERIEIPPDEKTIHFKFPQPKPSGRIVAEFRNVAKSYGSKLVFSGASFNIERGDRVALVGINGAGKSTLIKLLSGEEPVSLGEYTSGTT